MTEKKPCKHCNGTTYCGARRDPSGKLKLRTACTTCAVKSNLDPRVVYTLVVCSVCRGTGTEPEADATSVKQTIPLWAYLVVIPLMVLSWALAVLGGMAYERNSNRLKEEADLFQQEKVLRPEGGLAGDLLRKVRVGMDAAELTGALGEPDAVKTYDEGPELWLYRCRDKNVWVSVTGGKVTSAQ